MTQRKRRGGQWKTNVRSHLHDLRCRHGCLGFLGGEVAVEGDGVGVIVVARRRARRRDKTLGEHGWERPCSEALGCLLPPPPPLLLLVIDFFVQGKWWGVLDVEQLVACGHIWRSTGLDFVGWGWICIREGEEGEEQDQKDKGAEVLQGLIQTHETREFGLWCICVVMKPKMKESIGFMKRRGYL